MTFPFQEIANELQQEDLVRFSVNFNKIILDFLPCSEVNLLPLGDEAEVDGADARLHRGLKAVQAQRRPLFEDAGDDEKALFLPLWNGDQVFAVAVLYGADPELRQANAEWLLGQSYLISREFLLVKRFSIDPVTGLLNGGHLLTALQSAIDEICQTLPDVRAGLDDETCSLVLIEISPRGRSIERGLSYITRAGSYLDSLLGHSSPLHHLGSGIFCQLWHGVDVGSARKMGDVLLRRLKREDFVQGHLGITALDCQEMQHGFAAERFLEQAWQALRTARQRGPFALCAHASAADLESHPLKPPSQSVLARFKKLWRGKKRFAVALLYQDQEATSNHFSKRITFLLGQNIPFQLTSQREAYVYLDGANEAHALAWAKDFRKKMKKLGGASFSMGLAVYPCLDFSKSDMLLNARKALVHASFFGPDSKAVFDGVSLNISGDVYYNEGDWPRALKEYKKGLALDPENVNLLNSIGVTYAQMNRPRMAIPSFEKVLVIDAHNFMALYNMGFACLTNKKTAEAIDYFEKALPEDDQHRELLSQLGKLYCQTGRYEDAVNFLAKSLGGNGSEEGGEIDYGMAHRYLGEAYKALGQNQQAIAHLQKAIRHNAQYPAALSMLGELYAMEGEGDDIALALCRQAIELDDSHAEYWRRLGWLQSRLNNGREATAALKKSLQCDRRNTDAAFMLGKIYERQGRVRRAKEMYERVLRIEPGHGQANAALSEIR